MDCYICNKPEEEVPLFEGISIGKIISVCEECAEERKIPLIKKPSLNQLEKADEHHSVRERMERMSGMRRTTALSTEGEDGQSTLAKLRAPPKKESNEKVVDNYDWNLSLNRRRSKLSLKQMAEKTGVDKEILYSIERGRIPKDFEEIFSKLEDKLGIKLLRQRQEKVSFVQKQNNEKAILESVQRKMDGNSNDSDEELLKDEDMQVPDIPKKNPSLNDLIDRKRKREKQEVQKQAEARTSAMIGDDLDLDIDEL